jgi:hypothetical protein
MCDDIEKQKKQKRQNIMEMIKDDPSILRDADEEILEDKEFMLELLKINFDAIRYIAFYYYGCYCAKCDSSISYECECSHL